MEKIRILKKKLVNIACSFTCSVAEASIVCTEAGRKMSYMLFFLCGNLQNSFGPHKSPRHT